MADDRLPANKYGCRRCNARPYAAHHQMCRNRDSFVDKSAWDRGWDAGRSGKDKDRTEFSLAYAAGYGIGVIALEEAENVSWRDYYDYYGD